MVGLCHGEGVVDVAPWIDVGGQGTIHGHTKHVLLLGDDSTTAVTAEVSELL